jgi:hypothetical protein
MGEVVNVVVAFAVIVLIVRWATASSAFQSFCDRPLLFSSIRGGESTEEQAAARALRFRPKKVTPEMVQHRFDLFTYPADTLNIGGNSYWNVPRHPIVRPSNNMCGKGLDFHLL